MQPSRSLDFISCYDRFECECLDVPLDWTGKESGRRAAVTIIRFPAKISVTDTRFGGAILVNSGRLHGSSEYF